jgi:hypothetical protein
MTTCQTSQQSNRVVVFADHHRPFEEMAKVLAHDLNGFYYHERTVSSLLSSTNNTPTLSPPLSAPLQLVQQQYPALVSVLRYEDSLSQRAIAMDALRGDTSSSSHDRYYQRLATRQYRTYENTLDHGKDAYDEDDNDNDDDDNYDDENNNEESTLSLSSSSSSQTSTTLLRVMLSTDLAARGLDIVDITHIIHMDLPDNVDGYVHRSGRTGRLNRPGQIISIITPDQEFVLQRIMNQLQVDITCIGRPRTTTST